jgi:hypothetical protein
MKGGWLVAGLACAFVPGWAWLAEPRPTRAESGAIPLAPTPEPAALPVVETESQRIAEPLPARAVEFEVSLPSQLEAQPQEERSVTPAAAEQVARRYFHAVVTVEELERALPADPESNTRTPERFPGYFAAVGVRDELAIPFTQLPRPSQLEPLPSLDLAAAGDDFARIYRNWSREDLLVENWRITRSAYAESARVLTERVANGPYDSKPVGQLFAMG